MTQKPLIPRAKVHDWIRDIEHNKRGHKDAINLLLTRQRTLSRYVHKSAGEIQLGSRRAVLFIQGALLRVFDLAGGRVRKVSSEQIADAQTRVGEAVPELLPIDDGFVERMRGIEWRAQPHILDEAWMALFERDVDSEEEVALEPEESLKLFLCMWVATEVLDGNWKPGRSFEGHSDYVHTPMEDSGN